MRREVREVTATRVAVLPIEMLRLLRVRRPSTALREVEVEPTVSIVIQRVDAADRLLVQWDNLLLIGIPAVKLLKLDAGGVCLIRKADHTVVGLPRR